MSDFLQQITMHGLAILESLGSQALKVLKYPVDPDQRIYVLYLASSLVLAGIVYSRIRADTSSARARNPSSFLKFLFPDDIWSNSSAWLDVRYFFFHQMVRLVIYGSFMAGLVTLGSDWASIAATFINGEVEIATETDFATGLLLVVVTVMTADLTAFITHYYQHKLPLLWEFHKIHHSATVLHPLSNYREHPFDNVLYAVSFAIAVAFVSLVSSLILGYVPTLTILLGGSGTFFFLYNLLGYNLRHSHIWLRWPGLFSKLFGSPAHHQVHHSFHRDHIDKNFAFMFPVWDLLFNTYHMPDDNRDLRFGLGTGEEPEYRSCLGLYFLPFKKVFLRFSDKKNA